MRRLVLVILALVVAACSDGGPVSEPGTLTAAVVGPEDAEGAAVVLLLGDGVAAVRPAGGTEVYSSIGDSQTRVVIVHPSGGELTFELDVADVTDPPGWVVEEVAAPEDALRSDVSAYAVEFVR